MGNKLCQSLSHCLGKLWFREYFATFKTNADASVSVYDEVESGEIRISLAAGKRWTWTDNKSLFISLVASMNSVCGPKVRTEIGTFEKSTVNITLNGEIPNNFP